jgi:hypothetical protein
MLWRIYVIRDRHPPQTVPPPCAFDQQIFYLAVGNGGADSISSDDLVSISDSLFDDIERPCELKHVIFGLQCVVDASLDDPDFFGEAKETYDIVNPLFEVGYMDLKSHCRQNLQLPIRAIKMSSSLTFKSYLS